MLQSITSIPVRAWRMRAAHYFSILVISWAAEPVLSAATFATPDCTITGLTHTFGNPRPGGPTSAITDSAAVGQFQQSPFTNQLTGTELVTSRFEAVAGKKFVFHAPPAGYGAIRLEVRSQWGSSYDGGALAASVTATFENLVGPAPVFISHFSEMSRDGAYLVSEQQFNVSPGTEFTGVQLSAQFAAPITNPITKVFDPFNFALSANVHSFQVLPDGIVMTLEPVQPSLTVALSPAGVMAEWPTNFSNWTLQTTTQLEPTNGWSAATNVPTVSGTNFIIIDSAREPSRYYRLKMQ